MRKLRMFAFLSLIVVFLFSTSLLPKGKFDFKQSGRSTPFQAATAVPWALHFHQGFNMQMWLTNKMVVGCQALDLSCGATGPDGKPIIGLEYPVGSGIEHLFGGGPWIGGIINGARRVNRGYPPEDFCEACRIVQDTLIDNIWLTSKNDTVYNPSVTGYYKTPMNRRGYDDDHDGKIDEDELDGLDNDGDWNSLTDDIGADGVPDSMETGCRGVYDPLTNPDPAFDNYNPAKYDSCHPDTSGKYPRMNNKDRYTEKNGIPDHGEPHVDEDYGAVSDEDAYSAASDNWSFVPVLPGRRPMNVKVFQKSYAWKGNYDGAILPLEYYFINTGRDTMKDVYIGFFADLDVGPYTAPKYYERNYAAYDTATRTGYIRNPIDAGSTPLGLTVIGTSQPLDSLKYVWVWHGFDWPGTGDSIIYSCMSGEFYGSNPDSNAPSYIRPNQSPDSLQDTRFLFSFGPFKGKNNAGFVYGDTLRAVFALVSGSSISDMLVNAQRARSMYDSGFVVAVNEPQEHKPASYALYQNYPNPFNPSTKIQYEIPAASDVMLNVYDLLGRKVATLVNERKSAGRYEVTWDASRLASGVYFYQIVAGKFFSVKKTILLR